MGLGDSRIRAKWVYTFCLLVGGMMYLWLIPPGQGPDETHHLFRAAQLAGLGGPARIENGVTGFDLPKLISADMEHLRYVTGLAHAKVPPDEWRYNYDRLRDWDDKTLAARRFGTCQFALYAPVSHLAQAAGVGIVRMLHWTTYDALYIGRLLNLLVSCAIIFCALNLLEKWPRPQLVVFLIVAAPRSLSLLASLSADALTISAAILVISLAIYLRECWSERGFIALLGCAALLALCKNAYFLVPLAAIPAIWQREEPRRKRAGWIALLAACATLPLALWLICIKGLMGASSGDHAATPAAQVQTLFTAPLEYAAGFASYVVGDLTNLRRGPLGYLGWGETKLAPWLLESYAVLIVAAAVIGFHAYAEKKPGLKTSVWQITLFIATLFVIYTALYVMTGRHVITRVQGRYLLPALPLLLLALPVLLRVRGRYWPAIAAGLWVCATVVAGIQTHERYWGDDGLSAGLARMVPRGKLGRLNDGRVALFAHAPAASSVRVPEGERRAIIEYGIGDGAWLGARPTDGVEFQVNGVSADGKRRLLWSAILAPTQTPEHRGVHKATIDLADAEELEFRTVPRENTYCAWSFWRSVRWR